MLRHHQTNPQAYKNTIKQHAANLKPKKCKRKPLPAVITRSLCS